MKVDSFDNGLSILTRTMRDGENLYSVAYQTEFGIFDIESLGADKFDEAVKKLKEYTIEIIEEYRDVIDAARCIYAYLDEKTAITAKQKSDSIAQQLHKKKYEIFYSHSRAENFDPSLALRVFRLESGSLQFEYDDRGDRHMFMVSRMSQPFYDIKPDNPKDYLGLIISFCTTELFKIYQNTGRPHLARYADKQFSQDLGL